MTSHNDDVCLYVHLFVCRLGSCGGRGSDATNGVTCIRGCSRSLKMAPFKFTVTVKLKNQ